MSPRPLLAFLLATSSLAAQCPFSTIWVTTAGAGCNPVSATATPPIAAIFSLSPCALRVGVGVLLNGDPPVLRVVVLGASQANLPLPSLGPGCVLVPSDDIVVATPVLASPVQFPVPPAMPVPLAVTVQGAILYSIQGGSAFQWAVSDALQIHLQ